MLDISVLSELIRDPRGALASRVIAEPAGAGNRGQSTVSAGRPIAAQIPGKCLCSGSECYAYIGFGQMDLQMNEPHHLLARRIVLWVLTPYALIWLAAVIRSALAEDTATDRIIGLLFGVFWGLSPVVVHARCTARRTSFDSLFLWMIGLCTSMALGVFVSWQVASGSAGRSESVVGILLAPLYQWLWLVSLVALQWTLLVGGKVLERMNDWHDRVIGKKAKQPDQRS